MTPPSNLPTAKFDTDLLRSMSQVSFTDVSDCNGTTCSALRCRQAFRLTDVCDVFSAEGELEMDHWPSKLNGHGSAICTNTSAHEATKSGLGQGASCQPLSTVSPAWFRGILYRCNRPTPVISTNCCQKLAWQYSPVFFHHRFLFSSFFITASLHRECIFSRVSRAKHS